MQDQNKVYGFTLSLFEYIETIPTLWDSVKGMSTPLVFNDEIDALWPEFISEHPDYLPEDNGMQFLSEDNGETYNKCHCGCPCIAHRDQTDLALLSVWSNFEIGKLLSPSRVIMGLSIR